MKNFKQVSRRGVMTLAVVSTAAGTSGCIGGFNLTHKLYGWNLGIGDGRWIAWLVFLAFVIVPIYQITLIVDALILNSIEFWSGSNPVSAQRKDLGKGRTLVTRRTEDPNVVRHELYSAGRLVHVLYVEKLGDDGLRILDKHGAPVLEGTASADRGIELVDATGTSGARLSRTQLKQVAKEIERGASPADEVARRLADSGQLHLIRGASAHLRRRIQA